MSAPVPSGNYRGGWPYRPPSREPLLTVREHCVIWGLIAALGIVMWSIFL